jgi:hypothetical protein
VTHPIPRPPLQFCGKESLGIQVDGFATFGDAPVVISLVDPNGEKIHQPPVKLARENARELAFEILRRV